MPHLSAQPLDGKTVFIANLFEMSVPVSEGILKVTQTKPPRRDDSVDVTTKDGTQHHLHSYEVISLLKQLEAGEKLQLARTFLRVVGAKNKG